MVSILPGLIVSLAIIYLHMDVCIRQSHCVMPTACRSLLPLQELVNSLILSPRASLTPPGQTCGRWSQTALWARSSRGSVGTVGWLSSSNKVPLLRPHQSSDPSDRTHIKVWAGTAVGRRQRDERWNGHKRRNEQIMAVNKSWHNGALQLYRDRKHCNVMDSGQQRSSHTSGTLEKDWVTARTQKDLFTGEGVAGRVMNAAYLHFETF